MRITTELKKTGSDFACSSLHPRQVPIPIHCFRLPPLPRILKGDAFAATAGPRLHPHTLHLLAFRSPFVRQVRLQIDSVTAS